MCGRLNQFAKLPALAVAGEPLRVRERKPRSREDRRSHVRVLNNICPTDYAEVLTADDDGGHSFVFKQPETDEERTLAEEALAGCPVEAIGRDGE
jgi:ferredoxin